MEGWRRPLAVMAIEPDPAGTVTIGNRRYSNVDVTVANEDEYKRLAQGYVCANCQEPQEVPFPAKCSLCGFAMRAEQLGRLNEAFKGVKWIGPRESNSQELDRLGELNERARRSGIVLPHIRGS